MGLSACCECDVFAWNSTNISIRINELGCAYVPFDTIFIFSSDFIHFFIKVFADIFAGLIGEVIFFDIFSPPLPHSGVPSVAPPVLYLSLGWKCPSRRLSGIHLVIAMPLAAQTEGYAIIKEALFYWNLLDMKWQPL